MTEPNPTTVAFIVVSTTLYVGSWIAYSLYVLLFRGLKSGITPCWTIHLASLKYPAIPALVVLVVGLLIGHIFLGMHGE